MFSRSLAKVRDASMPLCLFLAAEEHICRARQPGIWYDAYSNRSAYMNANAMQSERTLLAVQHHKAPTA